MPSAKEEANKIAADVKEATNESASDLSNAMGGGCSPQLTEKVLSSLTSVQGAVSKIQSAIGGTVSGLFMDDNLRKIYENAKKTNSVERVLNRCFTQVLFSGRQRMEIADVIISILSEKNSFGYYLKSLQMIQLCFLVWLWACSLLNFFPPKLRSSLIN